MHYFFLTLAIVAEVVGTSALKPSEGFTRLWPSVVVALAYGASFYFLSRSLSLIPIGVAYATWSGVGTALIVLIGWVAFGQKLSLPSLIGVALIIVGVVLLHGTTPDAHGSP
ncbi:MAG: multidrug efflux SMR transporter [Acidobacteriota bacterium]